MTHFIQSKRGQQTFQFAYQEPQFCGNAFLPQQAIIPLAFQTAMKSIPLVAKGDIIHEGQMIARAADDNSVHVHTSVPGTVLDIINVQFPDGQFFRGIHIETKGAFPLFGKVHPHYQWQECESENLIQAIEQAGLINTAAGIIPLAKSICTAKQNEISNLKIIMYDRDPTCKLDSFLSKHFTQQIAEGIGLLARALSVLQIELLVPETKKEPFILQMIKDLLPEQKVIYNTVKKIYPPNTIHHKLYTEKKSFLIDSYTALSTYDSIICNQPMLYSYVLLCGEALKQTKVFKIRIGTPIRNAIKECGGFKTKYAHIILNGLIQGIEAHTIDLPISKGIKSIHVVPHTHESKGSIDSCSHCGQCLRTCPMYIDPIKTVHAIRKQHYTNDVIHSISLCTACSCCSAACPVRIPLCNIIQDEAKKRNIHVL